MRRHGRSSCECADATRSIHGLIAFRETERQATSQQREARAEAKQRERVTTRGQGELFDAPVMETSYMTFLQQRYQQRARRMVADMLREGDEVAFEALVVAALQQPMTSFSDLKAWLGEWRQAGALEYLGIAAKGRALAVNRNHRLRWRGVPLSGT